MDSPKTTKLDVQSASKPDLGTEMVTVCVGPKRKEFVLHKSLVRDSTNYFFDPAFDGVVYMKEDYTDAFSLFVHWSYEGTIRKGYTSTTQHLHDLYDLYFLGEKIGLVKLQNHTMDAIQEFARQNDLRRELIMEKILRRVLTLQRKHDAGLRHFSVYMMSWFFIVEAAKELRAEQAEERQNNKNKTALEEEEEDSRDSTIQLSRAARQLVLEMGGIDSLFFHSFMSIHEFHLQVYARDTKAFEKEEDPRKPRDAGNLDDWCWFHYHGDGSSCKTAKSKGEEADTAAKEPDVKDRGGSRVKLEQNGED